MKPDDPALPSQSGRDLSVALGGIHSGMEDENDSSLSDRLCANACPVRRRGEKPGGFTRIPFAILHRNHLLITDKLKYMIYYLINDKESSMSQKARSEEHRPCLDRATVVQTALELLKRVGLDGLTTRRLADELGVKSPALYWHFHNKQELLDAMADALIRGAGMGPPRSGETWQQWLARRVHAYRTSLLAYPDSARIITEARQLSPATIRALNEELSAMVALGFDPVQALRTITALTNYVNGFILQEQSSQPPATPEPVSRDTLAELLSEGQAAPLLVALAESGSPYNEASFEYGLQALIEGCAAALNRRASKRT